MCDIIVQCALYNVSCISACIVSVEPELRMVSFVNLGSDSRSRVRSVEGLS